jgi:hypothetical protein
MMPWVIQSQHKGKIVLLYSIDKVCQCGFHSFEKNGRNQTKANGTDQIVGFLGQQLVAITIF